MKRILKIPTRQKILISVLILTISYLLFQRVNISFFLGAGDDISVDFVNPLVLAVQAILLMFWVAEFNVSGERFLTILGFPALGALVFSLFMELIVSTIFGQLGIISFVFISGLFFAFFIYIIFLTANIINVAYLQDIPLGQAGRAAYYILNMILVYLLYLMIVSNAVNLIIQIILLFSITFFVVNSTLWTIRLRVGKRMLVASSISFLISFAYLILAIWPIDVTYITFVLLILLYITLGLALEVRDRISRMVWIEYGLLLLFVFTVLLLISSWGINGPLV